jgi:hypothetical protein
MTGIFQMEGYQTVNLHFDLKLSPEAGRGTGRQMQTESLQNMFKSSIIRRQ